MQNLQRDIDIGLLRSFLAVIERGGITRAAESLNLTQAAVSLQIKRLEELIGTELFSRNNRKLDITNIGERLVPFAKQMTALNDETWNAIVAPEFQGEIKFGVPLDIVAAHIPQILRSFSRAWPKIKVTLVADATVALLEMLSAGKIDLTLTTEDRPGKDMLLADPLVWAGMKGGSAHKKRPLPISLGHRTCLFRQSAIDALTELQIDWNVITQFGNMESVFATLAADIAVAPVMSQTIPAELQMIDEGSGLPRLPTFYVNLEASSARDNHLVQELVKYIHMNFDNRIARIA